MHEVTIKKQEADAKTADVAERRRSNRAREKIDVGQWEDKKFLDTMKLIFGKEGVLGTAGSAMKAFNDFIWYGKVPGLIDAVAKFPSYTPSDVFFYECVAGQRDPGGTVSFSRQYTVVPSLMAIRFVPTIGSYSGAYSSAASNAARRLYNIIRQANSASSAYDPGELMKIIIAVGSVYAELINMKRALQALNKDDQYSRALSRLVVEACGFNYDNMSADREGWRSYYNTMVHLMTSFKIPAKLSIFMRWAWMNALIIKDSDCDNCQRYLFRPAIHYVYNDGTGKLTAVANNTVHTLNSFKSMLDTAYYGIFNSSAAITIFRDIQKAIDQSKLDANDLVYLQPISEEIYNQPFAEQYNPEVVNQIHNATLCGAIANVADFDITSSTDGTMVLSNPVPDFQCVISTLTGLTVTSETFLNYRGENHIISLLDNDTSVERVTVATRLKVRGELSNDTNNIFEFTADMFGTEICTTAEIYTFDRGGTAQDFDPSNSIAIYYLAMNTDLVAPSNEPIVRLYTQFDGAPKVTFFVTSNGAHHVFDTWRTHKTLVLIDSAAERRLHDACVLSELSYL